MKKFKVSLSYVDTFSLEIEALNEEDAIRSAETIIPEAVPDEFETEDGQLITCYADEYRGAEAEEIIPTIKIEIEKPAEEMKPCISCKKLIEKRLLSGVERCPPCTEKWVKS